MPQSVNEALWTKYRPRNFEEIVGQQAAVKLLQSSLERGDCHAFLFSGPPGTGKTSFSRICALELDADLLEFDGATQTGVDAIRTIRDGAGLHKPFDAKARVITIDEAHRLSGNAWDALLKIVEEPPSFLYWMFCTTNPSKLPATIRQRCKNVALTAVKERDLGELYDNICADEGIKLSDDVGDLIIREAHGSPRQMLVNLDACRDVKTKKEAAALIRAVTETDPVIELARFLIRRQGSWQNAMNIYKKLADENPEGVRIIIQNYYAKVIAGAKSDKDAISALTVMDAFAESYNTSEGNAPLLRSIARALLG